MDWVKIILTVLLVIAGYLVEYFKTKTQLIEKAKTAINQAEQMYEDTTKAGGQKMMWVVNELYAITPAILKPFITKDLLQDWVQKAFNAMAVYATKQLDKIVDKVIE